MNMENTKTRSLQFLKLLVFVSILCMVSYGSKAVDRLNELEHISANPWSTATTVAGSPSTFAIKSFQINAMNMFLSFLAAVSTTLLIIAIKK